ncbi:condensin complex subunit 2 [Diachasma alloeum]|uniref:condensin complex subunit 2 n=1 Tax=Diachasma alloeum TaxID=454923 RepID=UPI00073813C9|nr:condensin complex subunit 2 [Diachasma alloeum]
MDKKLTGLQELAQEGRETPGDTLRLIRRRSSILPRTNSDPLEFNDDSVERGRTRHESPATSSNSSRRSLNLGSVAQLSSPQIAAGVAECIKLNTENKITKKNAFSLKMIDFMTYMIKNRDENMSNLQVASTTLDVSAKIYGLRVDVLHQEAMDMVGNLDHETQNGVGNGENLGDYSDETSQRDNNPAKAKRKKRVPQVLTVVESLCCDPEIIKLEPPMLGDGDYQTSDMLLQVNAPRHVGLGLAIHPYNDYILDQRNPEAAEPNDKIPCTPVEIPEDSAIGSIFKEFEFLNWDSEYDPSNRVDDWTQCLSSANEAALPFDLNSSLPPDEDEDDDFFVNNDGIGDFVGEEVLAPAGHAQRQREHLIDVNVDDIMAHASTASDYSFFDEKLLEIKWRSGTKWTVKKAPKNMAMSLLEAERRATARKKKDFSYDLKSEMDEAMENKFAPMKKVKRKFKSMESKVVKPEENVGDLSNLFKFSYRPDDVHLMPKKAVGNGGERLGGAERRGSIHMDDYDNDGHGGDDYHHDNSMDDQQMVMPVSQNGNDHDEFASQGGFTGTNLVEAPKLTEKIYIPFSQRAKKLDMRHLKKCIWNSINTGNEDKENVAGEEAHDNGKENTDEPKPFADIYIHLPEMLNKNDAKELSFPIAFVSLLHLANEKKLKLMATEDFSDIIVTQDTAP